MNHYEQLSKLAQYYAAHPELHHGDRARERETHVPRTRTYRVRRRLRRMYCRAVRRVRTSLLVSSRVHP
jgi:hypothetical protein